MSERSEDRELTALETALREFRPQLDALDRSVLMYRAGRASVRGWVWPATAAITTTLAAVLAVLLMVRPVAPVVAQIVYVPAPAEVPQPTVERQPESAPSPAPEPLVMEPLDWGPLGCYYQMEESVLRWGLKGIPPPPPAPPLPETPTIEQLLRSL
jgi:hypothetical protein